MSLTVWKHLHRVSAHFAPVFVDFLIALAQVSVSRKMLVYVTVAFLSFN